MSLLEFLSTTKFVRVILTYLKNVFCILQQQTTSTSTMTTSAEPSHLLTIWKKGARQARVAPFNKPTTFPWTATLGTRAVAMMMAALWQLIGQTILVWIPFPLESKHSLNELFSCLNVKSKVSMDWPRRNLLRQSWVRILWGIYKPIKALYL